MKTMIIDLNTGQVNERPLEDPLAGGRLLSGQLVTEFADPKTDPLGPENALVFTSGPLAGRRVSTGGRLSVGCKSPLTKGIKEANAGGMAGDSLANLGYRALVFKGALPNDKPSVFILDEEGARFVDALPYWGLGNEALLDALKSDFGEGYAAISIGPAGEQLLLAAGVAVTDSNNKPFRMAARGGVGAVMGSKGLKAILLRRPDAKSNLSDSTEGKTSITGFNKHVASSDRVSVLREYGTASTVMPVQSMAGLPVRNFSKGALPSADEIGGDFMHDLIQERGGIGTITEACMRGCVIQCSNIFPDDKGELAVAPLEYETIGLVGSNLELTSLDEIAEINRLCNDLGLDTIEIGAALGVMMEAAEMENLPHGIDRDLLPRFGEVKRAVELVAETAEGTELGRLLGNGVVAAGTALGVERIPAVKNQAMSAYDPRAVKGTGVTYATSPQGADHTAGLTVFFPVDHRDASNAVKLSRASQLQRAAYDALALCAFNTSATGQQPEIVLDMLRKNYSVELPENWMDVLGMKVIQMEKAYNRAAGMTEADDRLPAYFTTEPHTPIESVFDVPGEEMDAIWD
jgi:aldehyde:ferredoxin oxidoreductase